MLLVYKLVQCIHIDLPFLFRLTTLQNRHDCSVVLLILLIDIPVTIYRRGVFIVIGFD
jgi:hypothetical protein